MRLVVVQDRPIIGYGNDYYFVNYSDIIKYGKLCDELIYCASVERTDDETKVQKLRKCDFPNVRIQEVIKSPLKELIHTSLFNQSQVKEVIDISDLVVIKTPSMTIGKWAFNYVRKTGKKYIVEVIACAWDTYWNHGIKGKLMSVFSYLNAKRMIGKAANVIYVTNKFLQKRYPTKGRSINCSNVVLGEIDNEVLKKRMTYIDNCDDNHVMKLGTAGAINVSFKGQRYVIEAIAKMKKRGQIFQYYLAGGGDKTKLEQLATELGVADQVIFLGALRKDKMNDFYDSLDIYIHPSLAEGLPRVLIEAERRALPSCGANASGTPELLDPEYVFKKRNSDDICKVLSLFNKKTMKEQAEKNHKRSAQYSLDILDKRREVFYKEVLENN